MFNAQTITPTDATRQISYLLGWPKLLWSAMRPYSNAVAEIPQIGWIY
ncbi:hypothetical protein E5Q_06174 [Mixia osmundae IAM 14324]|uniref:Uncharacterized protein n=1 Tax=Mixia osmundae (strain CBS 9802 / IAM 14324 / JCM 22182 / KY 12970) TaxID=764103 RepID=G7E8K7_MIXOS|nr:hypothetical protein E5Q_06174 [Mixia osmundae IAM 14324]